VHQRFGLRASRSQLRERLRNADEFVGLMRELRQVAAKRALLSQPPFPLPVICLDQGEELFGSNAGEESEQLLRLARAASEADQALILATIRSDVYGRMQNSKAFTGIDPVPLSLGPVPQGEIASIIREPAEILRRKVGPDAPVFDAAVVEKLQIEIEGEPDALPLLAFVLQRLMREHAGESVIGLSQIHASGGLAETIQLEAQAAFSDAGYADSHADCREALRKLFVPPLVRISRESKAPHRRVALQTELPAQLLPLARALTQRRLLVVRTNMPGSGGAMAGATDVGSAAIEGGRAPGGTIEVAHEALLRHWTMLAKILGEDRDALLLLDSVLLAAADWAKAEALRKPDFLVHRGSRLTDTQSLALRGPSWSREIAPVQPYLAACQEREDAERRSKRRSYVVVGLLLAVIATGVLAALNSDRLSRISHWFFNVRNYVKSEAQERALLEQRTPFKECRDCPEMIFVSGGVFRRGGPLLGSPDPNRESPLTDVKMRRGFALSVTEISFSQWDVCANQGACKQGVSSGEWGRGKQPVIRVSWNDANDYVKWISSLTGKKYRLLSEAEWEYAARGGQTTNYSFRDSEIDQYAWHAGNSQGRPHEVGSLKPNPYGLKDMHGNVAEWVEDCWHENYKDAPLTEMAWTTGRYCDQRRVVRGGNSLSDVKALRSASRDWHPIDDDSSDQVGFRIAREINASDAR
jgi:formylglycine-generating enzyme required for sulfatase activity